MHYTIKQMSEMFGVSEHTLRYYTDLGLAPDDTNPKLWTAENRPKH